MSDGVQVGQWWTSDTGNTFEVVELLDAGRVRVRLVAQKLGAGRGIGETFVWHRSSLTHTTMWLLK